MDEHLFQFLGIEIQNLELYVFIIIIILITEYTTIQNCFNKSLILSSGLHFPQLIR